MHLTDLNECLWELPEIGIFEFFRSHRPIEGPFRWTGEDAIDAVSDARIGPICVDDRGVEYVVHALPKAKITEAKISRVTRLNGTTRIQDMAHSGDVSPDLRAALVAFASGPIRKKAA